MSEPNLNNIAEKLKELFPEENFRKEFLPLGQCLLVGDHFVVTDWNGWVGYVEDTGDNSTFKEQIFFFAFRKGTTEDLKCILHFDPSFEGLSDSDKKYLFTTKVTKLRKEIQEWSYDHLHFSRGFIPAITDHDNLITSCQDSFDIKRIQDVP